MQPHAYIDFAPAQQSTQNAAGTTTSLTTPPNMAGFGALFPVLQLLDSEKSSDTIVGHAYFPAMMMQRRGGRRAIFDVNFLASGRQLCESIG
jgi:hypothetical protein